MDVLNPHQFDLPPGDAVKCGLRTDLPKKERRHIWLDAGVDVRHRFSGEYGDSQIKICSRCGADQGESVKK